MAASSRPTPPDLSVVADRLHSAAIHLLRRLRKTDEATGLSPARLSALSVLVFGGPRSLGELAAAEQVQPPTMSRLVAALEAAGLVERRPDARDGRATRLRATRKGGRVLQTGRRRRIQALVGLLQTLPRDELRLLHRATGIIEEVLGNTGRGRRR